MWGAPKDFHLLFFSYLAYISRCICTKRPNCHRLLPRCRKERLNGAHRPAYGRDIKGSPFNHPSIPHICILIGEIDQRLGAIIVTVEFNLSQLVLPLLCLRRLRSYYRDTQADRCTDLPSNWPTSSCERAICNFPLTPIIPHILESCACFRWKYRSQKTQGSEVLVIEYPAPKPKMPVPLH